MWQCGCCNSCEGLWLGSLLSFVEQTHGWQCCVCEACDYISKRRTRLAKLWVSEHGDGDGIWGNECDGRSAIRRSLTTPPNVFFAALHLLHICVIREWGKLRKNHVLSHQTLQSYVAPSLILIFFFKWTKL